MKKLLAVILAVIMLVSICSCTTKEERNLYNAQEAARQAEENYKNAVKESEQLQRDLENLERSYDAIENAK